MPFLRTEGNFRSPDEITRDAIMRRKALGPPRCENCKAYVYRVESNNKVMWVSHTLTPPRNQGKINCPNHKPVPPKKRRKK